MSFADGAAAIEAMPVTRSPHRLMLRRVNCLAYFMAFDPKLRRSNEQLSARSIFAVSAHGCWRPPATDEAESRCDAVLSHPPCGIGSLARQHQSIDRPTLAELGSCSFGHHP